MDKDEDVDYGKDNNTDPGHTDDKKDYQDRHHNTHRQSDTTPFLPNYTKTDKNKTKTKMDKTNTLKEEDNHKARHSRRRARGLPPATQHRSTPRSRRRAWRPTGSLRQPGAAAGAAAPPWWAPCVPARQPRFIRVAGGSAGGKAARGLGGTAPNPG